MATKLVTHATEVYTPFNKAYAIDVSRFNQYLVYTLLNSSFDSSHFNYLFSNPSEFISSIRKYPIDFESLLTPELQQNLLIDVYVGNNTAIVDSHNTKLQGYAIGELQFYNPSHFIEKCKIATINIARKYSNFLDFNPYTKIEIHIPFCSPIELNPVDVYDKTISVYCIPDFNTGKGTIYVENDDRILYITQVTISVDIPLGNTNAVENTRNQVNNWYNLASGVTQGLIGTTTGNPFGVTQGLGLISSSLINSVNNNVIHYTSKGVGSGVGNMYNPLNVYSVVRYPKLVNTTPFQQVTYNHLYGRPLMEVKDLNTLSGYTEIEEIHLIGFDTALDTELQEIYQLLKEGVILN